ncbi:hypothetical protein BJF79_04735 [Actinomadura sp. CNU-125]|nr:hypothetical protein BJF79_04735 [Actinomadura sp. CNU-125]
MTTALVAAVWAAVVIAVGCLAARRTRLPRAIEESEVRLRWHPVVSALTGAFTALCCLLLVIGLLAAGAAVAGREQAGRAAGGLLLAGPNLLGVLLTSGAGEPWEAALRRERGNGAGMMGMLGGMGGMGGMGGQAGGGAEDRVVSVPGWPVGGVPLWLIGLLVLGVFLLLVGYLAGARTPPRSLAEIVFASLNRHLELGLRAAGIMCGLALVVCLLSRASLRIGISVMGSEMGGTTAALGGAVGFSALTSPVVAVLAVSTGSFLRTLRSGRRGKAPR